MLQNFKSSEIKKNNKLTKYFLNAEFKELNISCNIYKGEFYLDCSINI